MKQFKCPDCKVKMDTCDGCQRYCSKEEKTNIFPNISPAYPTYPVFPNTYVFTPYEYECCKDCSNNPANGGSGICNCTLPYFEKSTKYNTATTTTITTTNLLINNTNNGENL